MPEILAKLFGGCEERFLDANFQGCREEKDTFSYLHENETSLKRISRGKNPRWLKEEWSGGRHLWERRISQHLGTAGLKLLQILALRKHPSEKLSIFISPRSL